VTPASRRIFPFILFFASLPGSGLPAWPDLIIFHTGDFRYGEVTELPNQEISLVEDGITRRYKKPQIREIIKGINKPAPGEVVTATDFIHAATAELTAVTGAITHRSRIKDGAGKEIVLDVEDGFEVPGLRMWRSRYPFYQREGCFIAGLLVNSTTRAWSNTTFRVTLYDTKDRVLASKDFYVFRLPPSTPPKPGTRKFELDFPDVPYPRVTRLRVARCF